MPLAFSVITPSYNQGQFIERTIQSVLAQTEVELDYIVCDGKSTDNTVEILKRYQQQLRWVSEPDAGQADAVNKGINATCGEIIAWINSDDIYYADAFKKVSQVFEMRPDIQVIYGDANNIDAADQLIEAYPTEKWNYARLKETCFISQPATFFRRSFAERLGRLNPKLQFCMDYELWLRYGQHTDFYHLPEVLAGSRIYQNTKTLGQRVAVHYEINEMLKEKFSISPEKWVLSYASIVAEEKANRRAPDPENPDPENPDLEEKSTIPAAKVNQMGIFLEEAFHGYSRWRGNRISFSTLWVLFKVIALPAYNRTRALLFKS